MSARFNLGEYEVLQALKSGGMGEVLLARRRGPAGFEQLCAVKTIRGELANAPVARTMFLDEARLLARLTHPAIAQIIDVGEHAGTLYMVMEYVPGVHFRRFGELRPPPAIVCAAMAEACRGLHAAHELRDVGDGHQLGVVHRDVSPDNLMLGFDGRVKVLDFGIALVRGRHAPVTELGVLKGKPPYMSPEQVKNEALDRRSDVFSACVVLHELLTGELLFQGDSIYAVARAVEHAVIERPSRRRAGLPEELDDVVMAGLERDREQRLATAAAMAEVLERIAAQTARESLEVWVERELGAQRDEHRRWLAGVVAQSRMMMAVGRPTGMVTAIDDSIGRKTTLDAEPATNPAPVPVPDLDELPAPRRARLVPALFALLALAALAIFLARRGCETATVVAPALDAALLADAALADAATPALPLDAASTPPPLRDAGRRPARDASTASLPPPPPVDAAPASTPPPPVDAAAADGFLTIHSDPYTNVDVDGDDWGTTPIFTRRVRAGRHTIILRSPDDNHVVLRRQVDVIPGKTLEVHP